MSDFKNDILIGEAFDKALVGAITSVRKHVRIHAPLYKIHDSADVTVLSLFGGSWRWIIDRTKHELYELSDHRIVEASANDDYYRIDSITTEKKLFPLLVNGFQFRSIVFSYLRTLLSAQMSKLGMIEEKDYITDVLQVMAMLGSQVTPDELVRQKKALNKASVQLIHTSWGKNKRWDKAIGTIGKVLWSKLDPKVASVAVKMAGRKMTSEHYQLAWKHFAEANKVASHSPSLLPVWTVTLDLAGASILDSADRLAAEHQTSPLVLPSARLDPNNIVQLCQNAFVPELSPRAWKYLLHLKPFWVQYLLQSIKPWTAIPSRTFYDLNTPNLDIPNRVNSMALFLDLMSEVGTPPSFSFFNRLAQNAGDLVNTRSMAAFLRAACKQSRKRPVKKFWTDHFHLAFDWWTHGPNHQRALDRNQLKADWSWFERQQKQWHEAVLANAKLAIENYSWTPILDKFIVTVNKQDYEIVPLACSHDLYDEGQAMRHCVSTYSHSCISGHSRIFSIKHEDKRCATLELTRLSRLNVMNNTKPLDEYGYRWEVAQVRGPCNAKVDDDIKTVGSLVAEALMKTWLALDVQVRKNFIQPSSGDKVIAEIIQEEDNQVFPPLLDAIENEAQRLVEEAIPIEV